MNLYSCSDSNDLSSEYQYWKQNENNVQSTFKCPEWSSTDSEDRPEWPCPPRVQRHVHEVLGSVEIAERATDPHNHRFATVSGQAIPWGGTHVHEVKFRTDFYEDHFHEFRGRTLGAIPVGDRHVHFLQSVTTEVDGHRHEFRVGTLIDDPIGD